MPEIFKHIIQELQLIESLAKTRKVRIAFDKKTKEKTGYLKKLKPKGFVLEVSSFDYLHLDTGDHVKPAVSGKNIKFKVTDAFISNKGASFTPTNRNHDIKIKIHDFKSKSSRFKAAYYFRKVIPIKTSFHFHSIISDQSYEHDGGVSTRGLVQLEVCLKSFHVFEVEHNKKIYLVMDCLDKLTIDDFSEITWSVSVALGYLTGHLLQDEEYTFYYLTKQHRRLVNYEYSQSRDSIKSFYTPVNANPYAWVKRNKTANFYYGKITEVTPVQLSTLCNLIHKEDDIRAIVLLITESISRSLLLMPAGLSVALEGLSEFFWSKNMKTIKPIKDAGLASSFKKELTTILEKYKEMEGFSGYEIMLSKITNINSPTNREKLKSPFTVLNILLTPVDEEVIEYRNDFLHGNINLNVRKGKKKYAMDSFEISMRLLTLLNMILMKMSGYKGYIINHAKTQERGLKKIINEEYYREI
ncbi:MAG: hypothetical protein JST86_18480 [Bacteroidetes bacterium]|nr:hypothetical protein [Bacteroidota bacterium]